MGIEQPKTQSIVIEGGDQVGKGTALENLLNYLSEEGVETLPLSFPNYGTPVGAAIRIVQTTRCLEERGLESDEVIKCKMALYALNRLEVINFVLEKEDQGKTYVWDRSAYSNAVSLGYHYSCTGNRVDSKVEENIETALEMDEFLRKSFNTDNCIIRLQMSGESWKPQRGEGEDNHEKSDVQELSNQIYDLYREKIGEGWKDVVTKDSGKWRSHKEILEDIMEFVSRRMELNKNSGDFPTKIHRFSNQEILSSLYGLHCEIPFVNEFDKAVRCNLKKDTYEYGMRVARGVVEKTKSISWYNENIKDAVRKLFQIAPDMEVVLNDIWGSNFGTKFVLSVTDEERRNS